MTVVRADRGEQIRETLIEWVGGGIDGYPDIQDALAALDSLLADLAAAERERDEAHRDHLEAHIRADNAVARAAELETALAFYADVANYVESTVPHPTRYASGVIGIEEDQGSIARAALASPAPDRTEAE